MAFGAIGLRRAERAFSSIVSEEATLARLEDGGLEWLASGEPSSYSFLLQELDGFLPSKTKERFATEPAGDLPGRGLFMVSLCGVHFCGDMNGGDFTGENKVFLADEQGFSSNQPFKDFGTVTDGNILVFESLLRAANEFLTLLDTLTGLGGTINPFFGVVGGGFLIWMLFR